jgi:hypothetical protein
MSSEEAFPRAYGYQEFDITELLLSNTMNLVPKSLNLRAYREGRPLRNVIDWQRGY